MELKGLFSIGFCVAVINIFVLQPVEISATLPLPKANEIKESKITKINELDKSNKADPKILPSKKPIVSKLIKKTDTQVKPLLQTKSGPKPVIPSILSKLTTTTPKPLIKPRITPKPKMASNPTLKKAIAPKPLHSNKISGRLVPESKIIEIVDKRISPIMNAITKASNNIKADTKDPSKLLRQIEPDSLERAESIHRGVKHMTNFMNIIQEVDKFLSTKTRRALKKLAYIYGGDGLLKPKGKLHILHKKKPILL